MEHIKPICSLESKLSFMSTCCIRIPSRNQDIVEKLVLTLCKLTVYSRDTTSLIAERGLALARAILLYWSNLQSEFLFSLISLFWVISSWQTVCQKKCCEHFINVPKMVQATVSKNHLFLYIFLSFEKMKILSLLYSRDDSFYPPLSYWPPNNDSLLKIFGKKRLL